MKLISLKNNLKEGIDVLGRMGSDGINSLPILKNFLLRASDGKIYLSATNLEIAITKIIPGKIIENGGITIPLSVMNSLAGNLQAERVQLELEGTILLLKTDNYEAKIQGVKEDDFPIIPKVVKPRFKFSIASGVLMDALVFSVNAAQATSLKPELHGILFDFQNNCLRVVATDSFRLAEKTIQEPQIETDEFVPCRALVPLKTIHEALRIFKDEKIKLTIEFDESQIVFRDETTEIISRLLGGEFPDYAAIIPKEASGEIIMSRNDFVNALKLTSSFADRLHEVRLKVKEGVKALEIASANQSLGENHFLVPAKVKGDPVEVVFNWKFLLDGVRDLISPNIILKLISDSRPAVITGAEDESYLYLLMPIKAG